VVVGLARQRAAAAQALRGPVRVGGTGSARRSAGRRVRFQRAAGAALVISGGAREVAFDAVAGRLCRARRDRAGRARRPARLDVHHRWTEVSADVLARGTPARAGRVGVDACAVAELLAVRAHATARLPVAPGYAICGRFARRARGAAGLDIVVRDAAAGAGMLAWGALRQGDLRTRVRRGIVCPVGRGIGSDCRGILPTRAAPATIQQQATARRGARTAHDAHQQRQENPPYIHAHSNDHWSLLRGHCRKRGSFVTDPKCAASSSSHVRRSASGRSCSLPCTPERGSENNGRCGGRTSTFELGRVYVRRLAPTGFDTIKAPKNQPAALGGPHPGLAAAPRAIPHRAKLVLCRNDGTMINFVTPSGLETETGLLRLSNSHATLHRKTRTLQNLLPIRPLRLEPPCTVYGYRRQHAAVEGGRNGEVRSRGRT
jgi:hypothetical protein